MLSITYVHTFETTHTFCSVVLVISVVADHELPFHRNFGLWLVVGNTLGLAGYEST